MQACRFCLGFKLHICHTVSLYMINAVEVAVKWEYRNETSISIFFEGKAKIFFAEMDPEYPDGHFVYSEYMYIVFSDI